MARPKTISNEAILEVARELFLERGPTIPTAEIARQLGISEGLLFKRFPTKHELFLAAMGIDQRPFWAEDMERLAGKGELKENLVQLCVRLLEFVRELLPRIMLMWSCRTPDHMKMVHDDDSPPRRALEAITRLFDQEIRLGRLRAADPELVARIFLGSTWNLVFMETIGQVEPKQDPMTFARRLVDTLWSGVAPREDTER